MGPRNRNPLQSLKVEPGTPPKVLKVGLQDPAPSPTPQNSKLSQDPLQSLKVGPLRRHHSLSNSFFSEYFFFLFAFFLLF